jgi:hypothetical protein
MKIKKMNWFVKLITLNMFIGITLAPFGIYVKEKYINNKFTINHEKIHWKQQIEMLIIFFYLWYLLEFILKFLFKGLKAYRLINFEKEAYTNDKDLNYLNNRKPFNWIKL